jgi:transcriptional regulator with XRE-family HTH domain
VAHEDPQRKKLRDLFERKRVHDIFDQWLYDFFYIDLRSNKNEVDPETVAKFIQELERAGEHEPSKRRKQLALVAKFLSGLSPKVELKFVERGSGPQGFKETFLEFLHGRGYVYYDPEPNDVVERIPMSGIKHVAADLKFAFNPACISELTETIGGGQRHLSRILDISEVSVSKWIHGATPRGGQLVKMWALAGALNVPFQFAQSENSPLLVTVPQPEPSLPAASVNDLKTIANVQFNPAPLRELMEVLGYGQNELGREIGASSTKIAYWMQGRYPPDVDPLARLTLLAQANGVAFSPYQRVP